MRVTVDTNILFQALYSSTGASHQILKLIRTGDLSLAISIPVYKEYQDVLKRKRSMDFIGKTEDEIDIVAINELEKKLLIGEICVFKFCTRQT